MRMFFARLKSQSVTEAKNRLKSVIKNDRINVTQNKTLEKMKKEVSAVLHRYCTDNEMPPQVSVTCNHGLEYVVTASIPIRHKEENYAG